MKKFNEYQFNNDFCYKDEEAFMSQSEDVCYIPENAESLDDCYNYEKLKNEMMEWLKDNPEYSSEMRMSTYELLNAMFHSLSWEFPSTYLESLWEFEED